MASAITTSAAALPGAAAPLGGAVPLGGAAPVAPAVALQVEYCAPDALRRHHASGWHDVLAVVRFDAAAPVIPAIPAAPGSPPAPLPGMAGLPGLGVMTPVLGDSGLCAEVWRLAAPLQSGTHGRVQYRRHERLLFAALCLPEAQFTPDDVTDAVDASDAAPAQRLRAATASAYNELFSALAELGYPHPLRIWNYLPQINGANSGAERYWHFNDARHNAFIDAGRATGGNVPAATAVGTAPGGALTIYCIAARTAPIALENPRQCSAWQYPPQYGPRRPIFARACIDPDAGQTLFISGTASIVGHQSAHPGDVIAQTRETLSNIRALVQAANRRLGAERYAAERLHYKVYVRRPADQSAIEQTLRHQIGVAAPALFLRADICRRELLVEIEAVGA